MTHNAIPDVYGKDKGYAPLCSFDDSSLAFGASLIGTINGITNDDNNCPSRRLRLWEARGGIQK